jgi:chemotaxis protein methyltransferase CheR
MTTLQRYRVASGQSVDATAFPKGRAAMNDDRSGQRSVVARITDEELARFNEFLYRKTGIRMDEKKRYFSERRIQERIVASGCLTFTEYFSRLHFGKSGDELQQIVNLMTVNETYFFREEYQFECLVRSILDEVARTKTKGQPIRIWSVPCSSGEEPYSIAIYLLERWARVDDFEIELLASDIDTSALERAKTGVFDERALQLIPASYRLKYFKAAGTNSWQIIDDLRTSIDFSVVNVANPEATIKYRDVDIIFCRNLLIYFDDLSRRRAAEMFFEVLTPGGFICLGHSESMSRMSSFFEPRRFDDALVYQKPMTA